MVATAPPKAEPWSKRNPDRVNVVKRRSTLKIKLGKLRADLAAAMQEDAAASARVRALEDRRGQIYRGPSIADARIEAAEMTTLLAVAKGEAKIAAKHIQRLTGRIAVLELRHRSYLP